MRESHIWRMESMKTTQSLFLLSAIVLAGCTHTREIEYRWQKLPPEKVTGKDVIVSLRSDKPHEGKVIGATRDTLFLKTSTPDSLFPLPMSDVESIYLNGSATGPILGLLLGGAVGGAIGAAIGHASEEHDGPNFLRGIGTLIGAGIGAVAGGVTGVLVGASATAAEMFVFKVSTAQSTGTAGFVLLQVKELLRETETSITIEWDNGNTVLPKSQVSIQRKADGIFIRVPRLLLYDEHDNPIHFKE
jgi:hypothetical protein